MCVCVFVGGKGGGGGGVVKAAWVRGYNTIIYYTFYFHIVLKLEMNSYNPSEGDTLQICLVIQNLTATGETSLSTQIAADVNIQEDEASKYQYHTNVTLHVGTRLSMELLYSCHAMIVF